MANDWVRICFVVALVSYQDGASENSTVTQTSSVSTSDAHTTLSQELTTGFNAGIDEDRIQITTGFTPSSTHTTTEPAPDLDQSSSVAPPPGGAFGHDTDNSGTTSSGPVGVTDETTSASPSDVPDTPEISTSKRKGGFQNQTVSGSKRGKRRHEVMTRQEDFSLNVSEVTTCTDTVNDGSPRNGLFSTTQVSHGGRRKKGSKDSGGRKGKERKIKRSSNINNSTGIVSGSDLEAATVVLDIMAYSIYSISIVLNTVNVVIYCQPTMKNPVSTVIIAGNLFDVIANVGALTTDILTITYKSTFYRVIGNGIILALNHCSVCMMCLVAIERCSSIANPMNKRRISKHQKPIIAAVTVTVLALDITGLSSSGVDNETLSKDLEIVSLFTKVSFVYIGLLLLFLCNIITIIVLGIQARKRREMTGGAQVADRQTTKILLSMTMLYAMLSLPHTTLYVLADVNPDFQPGGKEHYFARLMFHVSKLMRSIVNVSDFIVFLLLSTKFRSSLKNMICNLRPRNQ